MTVGVVVAAVLPAGPIARSLHRVGERLGTPFRIRTLPYGSVGLGLVPVEPGNWLLVPVRMADWAGPTDRPEAERRRFRAEHEAALVRLLTAATAAGAAGTVVLLCPAPGAPGSRQEERLAERLRELPSTVMLTPPDILAPLGGAPVLRAVEAYGPLYTDDFFLALAAARVGVTGIRARGMDGRDEPAASIEEMVADYCALVGACQPTGPVLLAGYSLGGMVAWEMARRFLRDGREGPGAAAAEKRPGGAPVHRCRGGAVPVRPAPLPGGPEVRGGLAPSTTFAASSWAEITADPTAAGWYPADLPRPRCPPGCRSAATTSSPIAGTGRSRCRSTSTSSSAGTARARAGRWPNSRRWPSPYACTWWTRTATTSCSPAPPGRSRGPSTGSPPRPSRRVVRAGCRLYVWSGTVGMPMTDSVRTEPWAGP